MSLVVLLVGTYLLANSSAGALLHEVSMAPPRALAVGVKFLGQVGVGALTKAPSSRELQQLRDENMLLSHQVAALKQAADENRILRSLLGAKEEFGLPGILCRVIGRGFDNWRIWLGVNVMAGMVSCGKQEIRQVLRL